VIHRDTEDQTLYAKEAWTEKKNCSRERPLQTRGRLIVQTDLSENSAPTLLIYLPTNQSISLREIPASQDHAARLLIFSQPIGNFPAHTVFLALREDSSSLIACQIASTVSCVLNRGCRFEGITTNSWRSVPDGCCCSASVNIT